MSRRNLGRLDFIFGGQRWKKQTIEPIHCSICRSFDWVRGGLKVILISFNLYPPRFLIFSLTRIQLFIPNAMLTSQLLFTIAQHLKLQTRHNKVACIKLFYSVNLIELTGNCGLKTYLIIQSINPISRLHCAIYLP